jgi:hypothetical protein
MKINNVDVSGIAQAVKASGYPMNLEIDNIITEKDWERADKLANNLPGTGHNSFLKGIIVQADITAPQYWWLQFQRYHFADIVSSQSKMHKILEMDIEKQCNGYVSRIVIEELKWLIGQYNQAIKKEKNNIKPSTSSKKWFQAIIANTPMGFELTARITTNYLQLKTIYQQRRNHPLKEWHIFCDWIKELPKSEWIIGGVIIVPELEKALKYLKKAQGEIGGHEASLLIEDAIYEIRQHKEKME